MLGKHCPALCGTFKMISYQRKWDSATIILSYVTKVNNLSKGGYKGEETGLSVGYVNVLLLG